MIIPELLPIPHNETHHILDSTKLNTYLTCPRKFFYEYLLGWRQEGVEFHLEFGKAWHEAMEVLYRGEFSVASLFEAGDRFVGCYNKWIGEEVLDAKGKSQWHKTKTIENALLALNHYSQTYESDIEKYPHLVVEASGQVAISDGTEGEERLLAYKIDLAGVDKEGKVAVIEHKTSSRLDYIWKMQWQLAIQTGTYTHVQYDLFPEAQGHAVIMNGVQFGTKTPLFERERVQRAKAFMVVWLHQVNTLWDSIEDNLQILSQETADAPIMQSFPMNPISCNMYFGCPYHDLCSSLANPLRYCKSLQLGYVYKFWNPLEEEEEVAEEEREDAQSAEG